MSKIIVINSNSSGNSYILQCGEEILLIEAGLSYKKDILPVIHWDSDKVVGCLVTHKHADHAKYVNEFIIRAIPVYGHPSINAVIGLETKKKYCIRNFKVQCLEVPHGDTPCYSYIIDHEDIGRLLFITDCSFFKYKVANVNHLFIEANYDMETIENNACADIWNSSASNTHMSIENAIEAIRILKTNKLMNICLIHLSNGNSDMFKFKQMIDSEFGIEPYIAEPKLEIELKKEEF